MENEDQILLDQLKGGDYTAYELIFKKYYKVLSTKAYFMLEDDMEAEDLVQNLFISIWQKKLFLSVNTSIKAYLLRAVHNRCLTVLRDKKISERRLNEYTEEQSWQGEEDQETTEQEDYQGKFELIFEQLPTQRQKAFKLVYLEEKKYKEAAEEMGLSVNSIKTHLKLTTPEYISLSEMLREEANVTMMNPLSGDLAVMRQSLLFSALEAVSYNVNRRNSDLRLFEFGKSYQKVLLGYDEKKHLTLTVSGNRSAESWTGAQKPSDFFLFKGIVNTILTRLGIDKTQSEPTKSDMFAEGIALVIGEDTIVEFGSVKKSVLKHFDIKQEVLFADFNWDAVIKLVSNKIKFTDIPKYPEVRRDLALLVDQSVGFDASYNLARQTERGFLKYVNLFDVYEGKNLPEGKKSYAVSFTLQDTTKTLTDDQIDKIMGKLLKNFESQLGASLR